jgi:hypothetical protein
MDTPRSTLTQVAITVLVLGSLIAAAPLVFRDKSQVGAKASTDRQSARSQVPSPSPSVRLVSGAGHSPVANSAGADAASAELEHSAAAKGMQPVAAQIVKTKNPAPILKPEAVVAEALKVSFGAEITLTEVTLSDGALTLAGTVSKHRQIQDAREVAVKALNEAGYGPVVEDKIVNLLRKAY